MHVLKSYQKCFGTIINSRANEGHEGFAFSSGMAAITTVLSLFNQGDRILISDNLYGGSYRVLDKVFKRFGFEYDIVDTTQIENVKRIFNSNYKAI